MGEAPAVPVWVIVRIANDTSDGASNSCSDAYANRSSNTPSDTAKETSDSRCTGLLGTKSKTLAEATSTSPATFSTTTAIANHGWHRKLCIHRIRINHVSPL